MEEGPRPIADGGPPLLELASEVGDTLSGSVVPMWHTAFTLGLVRCRSKAKGSGKEKGKQ